jgi:hypothetical protein
VYTNILEEHAASIFRFEVTEHFSPEDGDIFSKALVCTHKTTFYHNTEDHSFITLLNLLEVEAVSSIYSIYRTQEALV